VFVKLFVFVVEACCVSVLVCVSWLAFVCVCSVVGDFVVAVLCVGESSVAFVVVVAFVAGVVEVVVVVVDSVCVFVCLECLFV
jgi:hypothetical protein